MSVAPPVLPTSRMTSPFGVRASRRTGAPTFHAGVDFRASTGDPVFAAAGGVVRVVASDDDRRERAPTNGYGNVVGVEHPELGVWTVYAHLSRVLVAVGDTVTPGQQVGEAGSTSNGKFPGMGTHLHFEVRTSPGDRAPFPGPYRRWNIDPQAWLAERGILIEGAVTVASSGVSGLGAQGSAAVLPAESDHGLPDEPVRDADTFDPPSDAVLAAFAALGVLVVAGAVTIVRSPF